MKAIDSDTDRRGVGVLLRRSEREYDMSLTSQEVFQNT